MTGKAILVFCAFFLIMGQVASANEILTLAEGLRIACENGRLIRMAAIDESISEQDARIERARMLPVINTSFSGTLLAYEPGAVFGSQTVPTAEKDFFSYSFSIQQTLYDFRANASRYESSRILADSRRLDTKRIRNLIAVEFAVRYFDLLESERLETIAENEVGRLESHLRDARNLNEEGVITRNDLLQAEVMLSDARQKLIRVRNLRATNESRINNALQRPLQSRVTVDDPGKESLSFADIDLESAWEIAAQQRPEIHIVDAMLKALDMDEKAKKAEYYPKIFGRGSYDYTENRYQVHQGNFSLTLGVGMNLFSGGSTSAEIAKLELQRLKMSEQRNKILEDIRLEVEHYFLDSLTARERIAASKDTVEQAEENLRINQVRYEEGVGTATDVLDAVTLLTVAETNYFRSLYDLRKSEAAVLYATGKDLLEVYK